MAGSVGALVIPVPLLSDNYAYLLIDLATKITAVVDPAEPTKVLEAAAAQGVEISMVLTTHKHWDHAGGNIEMARLIPDLQVFGGDIDSVDACNMPVSDGSTFQVGQTEVSCLHTPGHTKGHISYFCSSEATEGQVDESEEGLSNGEGRSASHHVFTGDVLFVGGCGKFFEGTAKEMYPSLYEKLAKLPMDTLVWPGHEYTVSNYRFAQSVEPENSKLSERVEWANNQRASGKFTVPSTIQRELETNVFLRCDTDVIKSSVCLPVNASIVDTLGALRSKKDKS